jgi:2-iminobutanoate/2-iminopropanoate deaminase
MNRQITPSSIAPPAANYVHAVLSESPGRMLHTSGVVPVGPDGQVPAGLAEQATTIWRNIGAMLDEADMTAHDVVSVTTYALVGEDLGPIMSARDKYLGTHRAASTLVTVPELAQPEWRMEISVVAAT